MEQQLIYRAPLGRAIRAVRVGSLMLALAAPPGMFVFRLTQLHDQQERDRQLHCTDNNRATDADGSRSNHVSTRPSGLDGELDLFNASIPLPVPSWIKGVQSVIEWGKQQRNEFLPNFTTSTSFQAEDFEPQRWSMKDVYLHTSLGNHLT